MKRMALINFPLKKVTVEMRENVNPQLSLSWRNIIAQKSLWTALNRFSINPYHGDYCCWTSYFSVFVVSFEVSSRTGDCVIRIFLLYFWFLRWLTDWLILLYIWSHFAVTLPSSWDQLHSPLIWWHTTNKDGGLNVKREGETFDKRKPKFRFLLLLSNSVSVALTKFLVVWNWI